jgi:hypothetical protein
MVEKFGTLDTNSPREFGVLNPFSGDFFPLFFLRCETYLGQQELLPRQIRPAGFA